MTFSHFTAPDPISLFTSTPPQLVSTKNDPQSSNLSITDYQYSLLRSLQQRYISPTHPTNKPPNNRREFAIALQSIIAYISVRKASPLGNRQQSISQSDLAAIERLKKDFTPELIKLSQQAKTTPSLEKTTFPLGTELSGELLLTGFGIGGNSIADEDNNDRRINAGYRARLNINTSFTGFDRLRIRLQKSDIAAVNRVTGSDMSRLSYQGNTEGQVVLNRLEYRFPIDNNTEIFATAIGGNLATFGDPLNPHLDSGSEGTISRFGVRNPIYRQGRGSGFGITHKIGTEFTLGLGYLVDDANAINKGLFDSSYGAIAQITYKPKPEFGIGINYIKSFNRLDTNTGSDRSNDPFDDTSNAIAADAFGVQSSVQISPNVYLGGWAGLTRAQAMDLPGNPTANIFNWAATLSLVDISGKDSLAGIIIGQPPKVTYNQFTANGTSFSDPDTSLHIEAFYRIPVTENVATTAGVLVITNPNHNAANSTTYVGVIRTLIKF
jgi:Carbohydrate-selective porin, OprB family